MLKKSSFFALVYVYFFIASIFFLGADTAVAGSPAVAIVHKIDGSASVMPGGKIPAKNLKAGEVLYEKDIVRTKSNSGIEIVFKGGNVITLGERSRLDISNYENTINNTKIMKLPRGVLKASVNGKDLKRHKGQKFEIHTPNACAGVRGTEFFVSHVNNVSTVAVDKGTVYVYNVESPAASKDIEAGFMTNIRKGRTPSASRPASMFLKKLKVITDVKGREGDRGDNAVKEDDDPAAIKEDQGTIDDSENIDGTDDPTSGTDTEDANDPDTNPDNEGTNPDGTTDADNDGASTDLNNDTGVITKEDTAVVDADIPVTENTVTEEAVTDVTDPETTLETPTTPTTPPVVYNLDFTFNTDGVVITAHSTFSAVGTVIIPSLTNSTAYENIQYTTDESAWNDVEKTIGITTAGTYTEYLASGYNHVFRSKTDTSSGTYDGGQMIGFLGGRYIQDYDLLGGGFYIQMGGYDATDPRHKQDEIYQTYRFIHVDNDGTAGIVFGRSSGNVDDITGDVTTTGFGTLIQLDQNLYAANTDITAHVVFDINQVAFNNVPIPTNFEFKMMNSTKTSIINASAMNIKYTNENYQLDTADWGVVNILMTSSFASSAFTYDNAWKAQLFENDMAGITEFIVYGEKWDFGLVDKDIRGNVYGYHQESTVPETSLFVGELVGTQYSYYDAGIVSNVTVAEMNTTGVFMDVDRVISMMSTTEGAADLANLGFPTWNVGSVTLDTVVSNSANIVAISLGSLNFFSTQSGAYPQMWLADSISGTYSAGFTNGDWAIVRNAADTFRSYIYFDNVNYTDSVWSAQIDNQSALVGGIDSNLAPHGIIVIVGGASGTLNDTFQTITGTGGGVVEP